MEATDESNQGMDTAGITLPLEELTVADEYLDEVVEEGDNEVFHEKLKRVKRPPIKLNVHIHDRKFVLNVGKCVVFEMLKKHTYLYVFLPSRF